LGAKRAVNHGFGPAEADNNHLSITEPPSARQPRLTWPAVVTAEDLPGRIDEPVRHRDRGQDLDASPEAREAMGGSRRVLEGQRQLPPAALIGRERGLLAERGGAAWPGLDDDALFELGVDSCLLMLTEAGDTFPRGPTIWRAGSR
jgi:hypothetical protein